MLSSWSSKTLNLQTNNLKKTKIKKLSDLQVYNQFKTSLLLQVAKKPEELHIRNQIGKEVPLYSQSMTLLQWW